MTINSKVLYLGNTDNEDCGFTPGNEYDAYDFGDGYIGVYDNNDVYRYIKNGAFHKFDIERDRSGITTDDSRDSKVTDGGDFSLDEKMQYRMNGVMVPKSFFEDKLVEVERLKSRGVSVFIDFEVSF